MHRVVISLGSNIDKEKNLPAAVTLLSRVVEIVAVSSVYETTPVGLREQPDFFNAAVLLRTDMTAAALKDGPLAEIEQQLKRKRTTDKNAPRTIDLDIALYDESRFEYIPADGRTRHVPDPDLLRFVHCALPLADLLPNTNHPETGEPLSMLAERLLRETTAAHGDIIRERPDIDLRLALRT